MRYLFILLILVGCKASHLKVDKSYVETEKSSYIEEKVATEASYSNHSILNYIDSNIVVDIVEEYFESGVLKSKHVSNRSNFKTSNEVVKVDSIISKRSDIIESVVSKESIKTINKDKVNLLNIYIYIFIFIVIIFIIKKWGSYLKSKFNF